MHLRKIALKGFLFGMWFCLVSNAMGQDTLKPITDTIIEVVQPPKPDFDSARIAQKVDSARRQGKSNDTSLVKQLNRMETYADHLSKMAIYFQQGLDTATISNEIEDVEAQVKLAREGIFGSSRSLNMRNLVATRILLIELDKELERWKKELASYNQHLLSMRNTLDSMSKDSAIRVIPSDSVLAQQYVSRIWDLAKRFEPIDSMVSKATVHVGVLHGRVVRNLLDARDQLGNVDQQIKNLRSHYFSRAEGPIWKAGLRKDANEDIFGFSLQKAKLVLKYYLGNTLDITVTVLVLILVIWFLLSLMMRRIEQSNKELLLQHFTPHLKKSVFLSSVFVVIAISQTFYTNIPMVFLEMLWLVMYITSTLLFWQNLSAVAKRIWLGFGLLLLWASFENLILVSGAVERWLMLAASLAGICLALYALYVYNIGKAQIQFFRFFIYLFLLQEGLAAVSNIFGMYTFGRAMSVGGYFNFVIGLMFFQGIVLLREIIVLSYEFFHRSSRVSAVVNLQELKKNAEKFLPIVAWVGWGIIFAKNLNFYDLFLEGVTTFITAERKLGNLVFSFGSIAIFFIAIWVSTLLAKFVSFVLGGDKSQVQAIQKTRFGSSILVLKILIISLGVIVAFAASGIPLDKITIIIGALGIGIGFGLQNIVSNLISGVILAFEKPIEIGDQIEVGGRLGKVKEIGIRSSKLATFDGAEVIIPNGDLLSQHVVNWTLNNNHRRVEILVGVKYGSNLKGAQSLLQEALTANNMVDKYPTPLVLVHEFSNSSIDFRLLFWTDITVWMELKSDIMLAVDAAFRNAGIEIPFPQQDVYIKQMPNAMDGHAVADDKKDEPTINKSEGKMED